MIRKASLIRGLCCAALAAGVARSPLPAQPIPLAAEQQVNEVTASSDFEPAIGVSAGGDLLVVWSRLNGDGDGTGLFGRHTPAGDPAEDEFALNFFTASSQSQPDLDMNGSRDFSVVWSSLNQASASSSFDLIARQSSADGTVLPGEFLAEEVTTDGISDPAVASDAADGFVTAWLRSQTVFARQFDGGGFAGGELTVAVGSVNMRSPDVGVDGQRGFVVVWEDADSDESGIWGRIYDESGANPSAIFRVNLVETGGQSEPRVAMAANGEFVVVWVKSILPSVSIEGRRFRRDGTPVGGDFPISPDDGNQHFSAAVDGHADGSFVVVWNRQVPVRTVRRPGLEGDGGATRVFSREYQRTARPVDAAFEESSQPGVDTQKAPVVGVGGKLWITAWVAPDADGDGIYSRAYLRRAVFADDFEGAAASEAWSAVVP